MLLVLLMIFGGNVLASVGSVTHLVHSLYNDHVNPGLEFQFMTE